MNMGTDELNSEFSRLVSRYLSGELSQEEQSTFRKELELDPGKQVLLDEYRKIWESTHLSIDIGYARPGRYVALRPTGCSGAVWLLFIF